MPRTSTFDRLLKTFDVESPFKKTRGNNFVSYFILFLVLVMIGYAISMYINNEKDE